MRTVVLTETDARFNLAAEEYFLKTAQGDVAMLWQNARSVIIGKNQNAWAEVNLPYAEKEGITVVRRLSGGGAVFHDIGNVNYTFITAYKEGAGIDFARFTAPLLALLQGMGIDAVLGGRNDILVDGRKISGNAQAVYRREDGAQKQLHHGTVLVEADLSALADVLHVSPAKLSAKGVKSVQSRVMNLREHPAFPKDMTVGAFVSLLADGLSDGTERTALTPEEREAILALKAEKYDTWAWNFGASLSHTTENTARFSYGTLTAALRAERGVIQDIRLYGDYFGVCPIEELEASLVGARLLREDIMAHIEKAPTPLACYIAGGCAADIVALLLGETQNV